MALNNGALVLTIRLGGAIYRISSSISLSDTNSCNHTDPAFELDTAIFWHPLKRDLNKHESRISLSIALCPN